MNQNFTFSVTTQSKEANTTITVETDAVGLQDVVREFASFLKAAGFYFDELEVVNLDREAPQTGGDL